MLNARYRTSGHGGAAGAGAGPGRPWSRPQDARSGNLLVATLTNIHDVLLKRHDPALYARLEKLEIFPQLYGIRWLRLLFGREFQVAICHYHYYYVTHYLMSNVSSFAIRSPCGTRS